MPSNCTSILQSLDQGIIRSLKAKYRFELTKLLVYKACGHLGDPSVDLTTFNLTRHVAIIDAIDILRTAWYAIETSTITNCWIKSSIAKYSNIIKMTNSSILHKRHETELVKHAKSIFKDPDIQQMFGTFEEEADYEVNVMRELKKEQLLMDNRHHCLVAPRAEECMHHYHRFTISATAMICQ